MLQELLPMLSETAPQEWRFILWGFAACQKTPPPYRLFNPDGRPGFGYV